MKIKTKLIISFCIIIFVPVFLATIAIVGFCNIQTHVIEETYGIKNANAYSIMSSVQLLNKYTVGDFEKIKHTIKQNSEVGYRLSAGTQFGSADKIFVSDRTSRKKSLL